MSKLWGGRFSHATDDLMRAFNNSIAFDVRLWQADITGSRAYARALRRAGIISQAELAAMLDGLDQIAAEFTAETFALQPADEDIHTAVERRLTELIGPTAGKLHTGRSRNDQVATDTRLWLRAEVDALRDHLTTAIHTIIRLAETHLDVLMPGFTHLQQAQPTRFSHWLLGFGWMLSRDLTRLTELRARVNVLPLGSGALTGNPIGIDRRFLADALAFDDVTYNSMNAVADRDYLVDFLSWAALCQTHLSALAEDLIIYSTDPFGFVEIAEAYSTGSSLMPQKKNPDSLELIRGKTGRVIGHLTGLLTTLKGLPSTYNKDLQEDKEALFDAADTLNLTLPVMTGVLNTMTIHPERMRNAMSSHLLATELADYLVSKGMPFRQAHDAVGQVVQLALQAGQPLWSLPLPVYQSVSGKFERDVHEWLDFERAVERRDSEGGTARAAVQEQIVQLKNRLADD